MSSGGFPERHLRRADSCPQGENALEADRQDQADSYCNQSNDGEVLNGGAYGWKDRHAPCRCIMALLANTSCDYRLGEQVLWETENWHIDAGAADSLHGKGTYPCTSWMDARAAWMAPGKQGARQQRLKAYEVLVKASWNNTVPEHLRGITQMGIPGQRSIRAVTNTKKLRFYEKMHANSRINTELH